MLLKVTLIQNSKKINFIRKKTQGRWKKLSNEEQELKNENQDETSLLEDEEEIEANNFAKDALINKNDYEHFVSKKNFSLLAIKKFASAQNVADFIVIGRLQKDGYIGWNMYTNLKPKYSILCYIQ